jgi:hypothetical protein
MEKEWMAKLMIVGIPRSFFLENVKLVIPEKGHEKIG